MTTHVVADIHQVQHGAKELRIVELSNSLDSESAWEFEQALDEIVSNGHYLIIIDLSKVDFISSAGWGIFTGEIKRIRDAGGDLKLAGMQPAVYEVFDLLELDAFITAHDTVEEATTAFEPVPVAAIPEAPAMPELPDEPEAVPEEAVAETSAEKTQKKSTAKRRKKKSAAGAKRSRKPRKKWAAAPTKKATAKTEQIESEDAEDGRQTPEATNGDADVTADVSANGAPAEDADESASPDLELPPENATTISNEPQPDLDAAAEDMAPPITTDEMAADSVVSAGSPVSDMRLVPSPPDERTVEINHRLSFDADVERLLGLLPVDAFGVSNDEFPNQAQPQPQLQTDILASPSREEELDGPSAPSWYSAIGSDEDVPESVALLSGPGAFLEQFSDNDLTEIHPVISEEVPVAGGDDTDHPKDDLSAHEAATVEARSDEPGEAKLPASEEADADGTSRDELDNAPAVLDEPPDEEKEPVEVVETPQAAHSGSEPESENARENPDPEDLEFEAECMFFEEAYRTDLYFRPSPLPEFDAVEEVAAEPPSINGLAGNEDGRDFTESHQTGIMPGEPSDGDQTLGSLSFDIRDIEVELPRPDSGNRQQELQEALGRRVDIEEIIRNFPDYGPDRIARLLNSSAFGYVRMHIDILQSTLGELDLDTPEKRQAFANCSEDADSGIVF